MTTDKTSKILTEELKVIKNSIVNNIDDRLKSFTTSSEKIERVGKVVQIKDAIATIYGIEDVMMSELIEFSSGVHGIAMSLEESSVSAIILGSDNDIKEGETVVATGKVLEIPTGPSLVGRVVDALGRPIDDAGEIENPIYRKIESEAPNIIDRESVSETMSTGIKAIDSLIPIGRGQRELIVGDRQTGKTAIAIDTIINQQKAHQENDEKNKLFCVYVAIGQRRSNVAKIIKMFTDLGVMEYTTIVVASSSDPASMQYLAAYTGCTIGEYFRDNGQHSLVVYDDLSKHAVAYRQISLLLRRPPGREAYPGDVFFLHSRLLERAAKMSKEKGGGSLTALPIVETQANDVSAYIPTNVISITDGQIFLESELFFKGVRPAINIGLSVSRVGSAAQTKSMKQVSGSIKLELAQYREMESFSQFSSDLDQETKDMLANGKTLTETLKQAQYSPLSIEEQVIILFAANNGYLKNIKLDKIEKFQKEILLYIKMKHNQIYQKLKKERKITDDLSTDIHKILDDFVRNFS